MSTTYSFVCDDCKKKCWSGQRDYIYKYKYIADFLHEHTGYSLRFLSDLADDEKSENYIDVEEDLD